MINKILFTFLLGLNAVFLLGQQDTLRIAVYNSPPFGMENKSGEIEGLMVMLWEDIAADLNLPYTYELTDMDGLISGLQSKKYEVGLGAISITPEREKMVDFTHAVNPSGTGIAVSKTSSSNSFLNKWMPILLNLLGLIGGLLLMLLVSAVIVYLIETKYTQGEKNDRDIQSIADGMWWSAVTMTTVGYGDKVPKSKAGKILGIVWIFTSIIFFSLFTANASAKLSQYRAQSEINSLEELFSAKVVAVENSSGEEFLIREKVKYEKVKNIQQAIEKVLNDEADAVVSNVPVLQYRNKFDYDNQLMISENFLLRNNMGIALQEESPLKERIDEMLLKKISEDKWQQAVYKYIGN